MNPQQYPQQPAQPPQSFPPQGPPGPYPPQGQPGPYGPPIPGATGQFPPPQASGGTLSPYPQQPAVPSQPPLPPNATPGYNPYGFTDEYSLPEPKKGPNKLVIASIFVLGLIAVTILALTMTSGGNDPTTNQTNNQPTDESNKEVVPRSDGQLDLSKRISLNNSLKAQTVQGNIKEQVNLSSGFSFMVNKIEEYTSPNPTTKPAEGKKFAVLTVVVGNRNEKSNLSVSYLDFRLRDESSAVVAGHVTTNEILNNHLASPAELKPGEQITGKIVFEVDATDTDWVLKHSETYQKTTDNTTFNVEGEIVLALSAASNSADTDTTSPTPSPSPATP